jgi:uncharacterized YigZ family protein
MAQESYITIQGESVGEYEEKKSRFIGRIRHVETEQDALSFIQQVRADNPLARHNVYAYVLRQKNRVRYSDDGEPQKTAGVPTLNVLQHAGLFDVVCVVTRYFGGTLLGTGGLVRAYTSATQDALRHAQLAKMALCCDVEVVVEYSDFDPLAHWLDQRQIPVTSTTYTDVVTLTVRCLASDADETCKAIDDFCQGRALMQAGDALFMPVPLS